MCKFLFLLKIPFLLFDFRKSEKERMREYRRELEEREEKLKNRPLLFERVAQVVFVGIWELLSAFFFFLTSLAPNFHRPFFFVLCNLLRHYYFCDSFTTSVSNLLKFEHCILMRFISLIKNMLLIHSFSK